MKKILIFILFPHFLFSQNWVDKMQDPSQNFYEVQNEFNDYWENKTIEKGKGWKQFKRWENFIGQRVFPDGVQYPELLLEEYNKLKDLNNSFRMLPTNSWEQVGPDNVPLQSNGSKRGIGRVNSIEFHPTDPNTLYVGAPAGGFWKSVDSGQNWTTTTDFLTNLGVSDIAVNPNNPDEIYIITGDRDGGDTYSYGLMKSLDGGITFNLTGLSFSVTSYYRGNRVLIDPINTNIIIVATSNGIYRSNDSGVSFIQTYSGINMTDIEFHTTNSNIIYGGSKGNTSIYKSIDNGINWSQSGSALPSMNDVSRVCVAVTIDNPQVVYAMFGGNDNGFYGVYKSNNEGQSWSLQSNSPNLLGWDSDGSDIGGQAWYDLAFEVSPTDENTLFVGGVNCWKSTNGGQSWNINTHWYGANGSTYMHADEHMLKYNPLNNYIYSANDGGLYYSDDNGSDWIDISDGLHITQFYSLGVSQTIQNKVITGAQDNGTFLKNNSNWDAVIGGDGMECIIDYTNSNIMYGAIYYGDIKKSTNGGNSFSSIGPSNNGAWETPYELDKNNPQIIYIGYDELQKSLDGGNSWIEITNGETNGGKIDEIGLSKSDPDIIYITDGSDIYRTLNAGISWSQVNNNLPNKMITYVIVSPNDENTVWVTLSGYTSGQKVYKSTNGGNNWVNISGTLPNVPVNCIELDNSSTLETIYIGTDLGVFTTDSTLNDWNLFNNNLPNVIVNELEMQYQSNTLFAATYGRGLWSIGLEITSPPIADFTYNDSIFCNIPASVDFLNNSYYSNTYYWDFGDGFTSNSNNPTHTYNSYGIFTVKLISTGPLGVDSIVKQQIISINSSNPCITTLPSSGAGITQTNCNGTLYDVGGPIGSYYSSSNSSITIAPQGSNQITLNFSQFDVEAPSVTSNCNYDYLEIFDGPDQSAPSLGQYCNSLTGSPGVIVSSGGAITILLYSDGGVEGAGFAVDWTCTFPQAPPVSIFNLSDSVSCNSTIAFTDLSTNGPFSWEWDFGDGNSSSLQNPVHTYLNSGIYTVKLTTTNAYGSDVVINNNAVNIIDVNLQTFGNNSCEGTTVVLTANSPSGLINWYDNSNLQNLLDTGNIFLTPILNTTTSYYAQAVYNFNPIYGGPLDNTIGNGGYYNNDRHLFIDCYKPSKLLSLDIYAGTPQAITFELRDNNSQVLCDTIINVQLGLNTLMLNFDIPVMNSLELGIGGTGSDLYRNSTGSVYPYQIGNLASITGHNSPNSNGYHYFFYNIQLAQEACVSSIESVDAEINSNFSINQSISICQGETYQIGNNIYSYTGMYYDTLLSVNNCDSIIITYLSVDSNFYNTQQVVLCENENYQIGNSVYSTAGIYIDTISYLNSCDSIFTTYLSFSYLAVQIYTQNNSLFSSVTSGIAPYSYLWSSGETTLSISPLISGTFWLLVNDNYNCTSDTAYFVIEDINDIHENNIISGLNIFPNPTEGLVEISFESIENGDFTISILNVLSEVIFEDELIQFSGFYQKKINLNNFAKSVYLVRIETSVTAINKKLILR